MTDTGKSQLKFEGSKCFPCGIRYKRSCEILEAKRGSVRLYKEDGVSGQVIFDMGPKAPGGYPVFYIKSFSAGAKLRISYFDRYNATASEKRKLIGDFARGQCKYLGIELPVMPANPGRFERYTLTREGEYIFPLIQGQQRFVCITLEEGNEAVLDSFLILYTSDMSEREGSFTCSDRLLEKLWQISADTVQLATIVSRQWDVADGKLLLRSLTKGEECGIYKGAEYGDFVFSGTFSISENPYMCSGIGFTFRAKDNHNGYIFSLDLDGNCRLFLRRKGVNHLLCQNFVKALTDNKIYKFEVHAQGNRLALYIDGILFLEHHDDSFYKGSFGFWQTPEKWAVVYSILIASDGAEKEYRITQSLLKEFDIFLSRPFIADGAKRDRLVWSGDLFWSGKNSMYAFGGLALKETLAQMLKVQTTDGFIWATFYPEENKKKVKGDYGYYQSDLFSAWHVPVMHDYVMFSGDIGFLKRQFQRIKNNLIYLWQYVESDGLFNQRYETSKGLWDHHLGDWGKHAYNNIIIWSAFYFGSRLAQLAGQKESAEFFLNCSDFIRKAVIKTFFDDGKGYFVKSLNNCTYCSMANSAALVMGMVEQAYAEKIGEALANKPFESGKITHMAIRGLFRYDMPEKAYKLLMGKNPVEGDWAKDLHIMWGILPELDDFPQTTWECMFYPPSAEPEAGWGDLSHPDTGVADILSGDVLGIKPLQPGFKLFEFRPRFVGEITCVEGVIPTPYGKISASCIKKEGFAVFTISVPKGARCVAIYGAEKAVLNYGIHSFALPDR